MTQLEFLQEVFNQGKILWFNAREARMLLSPLTNLSRISSLDTTVDFKHLPAISVEQYKALLETSINYELPVEVDRIIKGIKRKLTN